MRPSCQVALHDGLGLIRYVVELDFLESGVGALSGNVTGSHRLSDSRRRRPGRRDFAQRLSDESGWIVGFIMALGQTYLAYPLVN